MSLDSIFSLGESVLDKLFPDPLRRAEEMRKLEELRQTGDIARLDAHVKLMLGQLKVNEQEAKSKSIFVAGWRPAVGWVCVTVLAFNYIGVYLLEYASIFFEAMPPLPARMEMAELWPVLLGMLGIGGMRSFDKRSGTSTEKI